MKKYIALTLAVLTALLILASCGGDEPQAPADAQIIVAEAEKADPLSAKWETEDADGTKWTLTLENEGKGKFAIGGSSCEAEWEAKGDTITVTAVYGDEKETVLEGKYVLDKDTLTIETANGTKSFTAIETDEKGA